MSAITTELQVIPTPRLDADAHPAQTHVQDARMYVGNLARYARDLYTWVVECADLNRADQAVFLGTTGVVLTGLLVAVI
jgi:hypothetical protein